RAAERDKSRRLLSSFLTDADDEVRFLAAKWVADEKLKEHRPFLVEAMKQRNLNVRLFTAYATALARIDGKPVDDAELANYFLTRLTDETSGTGQRILALQNVPANHPRLTLDLLGKLLDQDDPLLQREAVRALGEHPSPRRFPLLEKAAT